MESAAIREQLTGEGMAESPVSPAVIGRPPGRTGPFIIAETESEARLAGRYALLAAAMFVGGLLVAGWTASIILPQFIF